MAPSKPHRPDTSPSDRSALALCCASGLDVVPADRDALFEIRVAGASISLLFLAGQRGDDAGRLPH